MFILSSILMFKCLMFKIKIIIKNIMFYLLPGYKNFKFLSTMKSAVL